MKHSLLGTLLAENVMELEEENEDGIRVITVIVHGNLQ